MQLSPRWSVLPNATSATELGHRPATGHFKKDCPKLKNNDRGNQGGNGNALAKVYAVGRAGTNPDSNVVTIFLEDLPGLSPTRQVEFQINLVHGATSVARFLTLGSSSLLCQEEGWIISNVHRLSGTEQADVRDEDIPKMALRTRYGHYEFQVISFGLTNAPAVFMDLVNRECKPFLDKFIIVFIDDILIYSKNKQEYEEHLKLILELLKKEELYAKFSKCEFWIPKVQFLSHVIDSQGIYVDPAKIESIKD
ncbi:putative reverse transcriptase domain-containing protein [Tanacetum coccineum]